MNVSGQVYEEENINAAVDAAAAIKLQAAQDILHLMLNHLQVDIFPVSTSPVGKSTVGTS